MLPFLSKFIYSRRYISHVSRCPSWTPSWIGLPKCAQAWQHFVTSVWSLKDAPRSWIISNKNFIRQFRIKRKTFRCRAIAVVHTWTYLWIKSVCIYYLISRGESYECVSCLNTDWDTVNCDFSEIDICGYRDESAAEIGWTRYHYGGKFYLLYQQQPPYFDCLTLNERCI